MESKHVCKKCHRELPDGFKKDICEYCENKGIAKFQNFCKGTAAVAVTVASTVLSVFFFSNKE